MKRTLATPTLLALACAGALLAGIGVRHSSVPPAALLPGPAGDHRTGLRPAGGPAASPVVQRPEHQTDLPGSSIRIPALGITAAIGSAVLDDGVLDPPRDPAEVGRWTGSATLAAAAGEVTLAGHVNWAGLPAFAFGRLAELHQGDLVYTADPRGVQSAWRVTAVTARAKSSGIDPAAFAGPDGSRRLALITCGGTYDPASASYADNVYVYAIPA
jgi:hypothetical protein